MKKKIKKIARTISQKDIEACSFLKSTDLGKIALWEIEIEISASFDDADEENFVSLYSPKLIDVCDPDDLR